MKRYVNHIIGGLLLAAAIAQPAAAATITSGSQIGTGGTLYVVGGDGSVANATGLDFALPNATSPGSAGILAGYAGTGALQAYTCATDIVTPCGTINDILSFATFSFDSNFIIATDIFSFSLTAPLTITRVPRSETSAAALLLSGNGILRFAGFDPTAAQFTLATLNSTEGTTTYTATLFAVDTTAVPEPASALLMGLGLSGLLLLRRKGAR